MSRPGKIARLPRQIRDTLNLRLDDGEQPKPLLQWLNSLDEVKEILAADFDARPINDQNLSEWKQRGFREWQRRRDACDQIRLLVEQSEELDNAAQDQNIPDRLAAVLAAELAAEALRLLQDTNDPGQRWQYLRQALRQVHLLRKGDHRAARARIDSARWQIECDQRERKNAMLAMDDARESITAPLQAAMRRPALVAACGGGEAGEKAADFILEIEQKYRVPRSHAQPCT